MTLAPAPDPARTGGWDRAAIVALGSAGCALSYDALQQMATAIHVRGPLTYLFPLVIDGFIAYGVRALILTRTAPLPARLYVWALFGIATAASIWANALHAIRLNQQTTSGGLRLGDHTVGILSTLAPLALAGAVHLYILIARHPTDHAQPEPPTSGTDHAPDPWFHFARIQRPAPASLNNSQNASTGPRQLEATDPLPEPADAPSRRTGRPPDAPLEELLAIGRTVAHRDGKVSRKAVLREIRERGLGVSNDRLKQVIDTLRTELRATDESGEEPTH